MSLPRRLIHNEYDLQDIASDRPSALYYSSHAAGAIRMQSKRSNANYVSTVTLRVTSLV